MTIGIGLPIGVAIAALVVLFYLLRCIRIV